MELEAFMKINGHITMTVKDKQSGEILEVFDDKNLVTTIGMDQILKSITVKDTNNFVIDTISIGDDIGSGTVMNPEQPSLTYTKNNQNVVYSVPSDLFSITRPSLTTVQLHATFDGERVMESYPDSPNLIYTSATIRTVGGEIISFKRFPARTISRLISVDVIWTLILS
jgi:hypothetical protein